MEIDPSDKRHIFDEQMKRLFFAMRKIELEDIDDAMLERFMTASAEQNKFRRSKLRCIRRG